MLIHKNENIKTVVSPEVFYICGQIKNFKVLLVSLEGFFWCTRYASKTTIFMAVSVIDSFVHTTHIQTLPL